MKALYTLSCSILLTFSSIAQDRTSDSIALVDIFNALDGPNWAEEYNNWLSEAPLDEWEGVRLTNDRVSQLILNNSNAKGAFPSEIFSLSELRTLETNDCDFTGELPSEIAQLQKLTRIAMRSCNFTGDFPNVLVDMPNLSNIGAAFNSFTGSLPDIGPNISLMYINNNQFSGDIPQSWYTNSINNLEIQSNQLTGGIEAFSTWDNAISLSIGENNWDAQPLPTWIDDLMNLSGFSCNRCNLVGPISDEIDFSQHPRMDNMQLSYNQLSGDVSRLFTGDNANRQLYLRVRFNDFSGEFPSHKLNQVNNISIEGNRFSSLTTFEYQDLNRFSIQKNSFNYEDLAVVLPLINVDSVIVNYQQQAMLLDTLMLDIMSASTISLESGDKSSDNVYAWYKDNTLMEDETSTTLDLAVSDNSFEGTYYCIITNPNFPDLILRRHPVFVTVNIPTSTNDEYFSNTSLFPNPASTFIQIESDKNLNQTAYSIVNTLGETVLSNALPTTKSIQIDRLERGIYYLQLFNDEGQQGYSFIKR